MADKQAQIRPDQTDTAPGAPTTVEHTPPEDQYTSGGQHQEQKQQQHQPPVEESAGLHRTGSFTGTSGGEGEGNKADKK
jgi:hypothetical protein